MSTAGKTENNMTAMNILRPPLASVRMPSGMRPRLPSRTGTARATLTWMGVRPIRSRKSGIIADTEPKIAKQTAKAPVASANCRPGLPGGAWASATGGGGMPTTLWLMGDLETVCLILSRGSGPLEIDEAAEQPQVHEQT